MGMKNLSGCIFTIFLILLIFNCEAGNTGIDLTGSWDITDSECLDSEKECRSLPAETITIPSNLKSSQPKFTGKVTMTKNFFADTAMQEIPVALMISGIGSADRVYINDYLIGQTGSFDETGCKSSAWNTVRYYHIPAQLLTDENQITIQIAACDVKSGIHRAPVVIDTHESLRNTKWLHSFFYEYIFYAETILLLFVFGFFILTLPIRGTDHGFLWITAAFLSYGLHSFYYIEWPGFSNHLTFLKLQWVFRIFSSEFTFLFFRSTLNMKGKIHKISLLLPGLMFSLWTLVSNSYSDYFKVALITQIYFCIMVAGHCTYFFMKRTEENKRQVYTIILSTPIVLVTYICDLSIRAYWSNLPFLYHYASLFNVLQFLVLYSLTLFAYKESNLRMQIAHLNERKKITHELHDSVAANLNEIKMFFSGHRPNSAEISEIEKLASESLESIRDLVSYNSKLSAGDKPLSEMILARSERLEKTGMYRVLTDIKQSTKHDPWIVYHIDRILSEWISNVVRHSKPDTIRIALKERDSSGLTVCILDNGKGIRQRFPVSEKTSGQKGLLHIGDRSQKMNAVTRALRFKDFNAFIIRLPAINKLKKRLQ